MRANQETGKGSAGRYSSASCVLVREPRPCRLDENGWCVAAAVELELITAWAVGGRPKTALISNVVKVTVPVLKSQGSRYFIYKLTRYVHDVNLGYFKVRVPCHAGGDTRGHFAELESA